MTNPKPKKKPGRLGIGKPPTRNPPPRRVTHRPPPSRKVSALTAIKGWGGKIKPVPFEEASKEIEAEKMAVLKDEVQKRETRIGKSFALRYKVLLEISADRAWTLVTETYQNFLAQWKKSEEVDVDLNGIMLPVVSRIILDRSSIANMPLKINLNSLSANKTGFWDFQFKVDAVGKSILVEGRAFDWSPEYLQKLNKKQSAALLTSLDFKLNDTDIFQIFEVILPYLETFKVELTAAEKKKFIEGEEKTP